MARKSNLLSTVTQAELDALWPELAKTRFTDRIVGAFKVVGGKVTASNTEELDKRTQAFKKVFARALRIGSARVDAIPGLSPSERREKKLAVLESLKDRFYNHIAQMREKLYGTDTHRSLFSRANIELAIQNLVKSGKVRPESANALASIAVYAEDELLTRDASQQKGEATRKMVDERYVQIADARDSETLKDRRAREQARPGQGNVRESALSRKDLALLQSSLARTGGDLMEKELKNAADTGIIPEYKPGGRRTPPVHFLNRMKVIQEKKNRDKRIEEAKPRGARDNVRHSKMVMRAIDVLYKQLRPDIPWTETRGRGATFKTGRKIDPMNKAGTRVGAEWNPEKMLKDYDDRRVIKNPGIGFEENQGARILGDVFESDPIGTTALMRLMNLAAAGRLGEVKIDPSLLDEKARQMLAQRKPDPLARTLYLKLMGKMFGEGQRQEVFHTKNPAIPEDQQQWPNMPNPRDKARSSKFREAREFDLGGDAWTRKQETLGRAGIASEMYRKAVAMHAKAQESTGDEANRLMSEAQETYRKAQELWARTGLPAESLSDPKWSSNPPHLIKQVRDRYEEHIRSGGDLAGDSEGRYRPFLAQIVRNATPENPYKGKLPPKLRQLLYEDTLILLGTEPNDFQDLAAAAEAGDYESARKARIYGMTRGRRSQVPLSNTTLPNDAITNDPREHLDVENRGGRPVLVMRPRSPDDPLFIRPMNPSPGSGPDPDYRYVRGARDGPGRFPRGLVTPRPLPSGAGGSGGYTVTRIPPEEPGRYIYGMARRKGSSASMNFLHFLMNKIRGR